MADNELAAEFELKFQDGTRKIKFRPKDILRLEDDKALDGKKVMRFVESARGETFKDVSMLTWFTLLAHGLLHCCENDIKKARELAEQVETPVMEFVPIVQHALTVGIVGPEKFRKAVKAAEEEGAAAAGEDPTSSPGAAG